MADLNIFSCPCQNLGNRQHIHITITITYSQIFEQKRDCSQSNPNCNIIESGNLENIIELCITEKTKRQIKTEKSQPEITCM